MVTQPIPNPVLNLALVRVCNEAPNISDRKAALSYAHPAGVSISADAAGWTIGDNAPHIEPRDSSPLTNLQRACMRVSSPEAFA